MESNPFIYVVCIKEDRGHPVGFWNC